MAKAGDNHIFIGILLVLAVISFFIVKPFITAILAGVILAYLLYPLCDIFNKKIKSRALCSFLILLIVFIIILLPFFFIIGSFAGNNASGMMTSISNFGSSFSGEAIKANCKERADFLCNSMVSMVDQVEAPYSKFIIGSGLSQLSEFIIKRITSIILEIPSMILGIFIMFFVLYYLLKDGGQFVEGLKGIIPLDKKDREKMFKELGDVVHATIYGNIIVALIQGLIAGLGFWVLGFGNAWILGILVAFAALIPIVGTAIIWLPVSLYAILMGMIQADNSGIIKGVIMILWGALAVSTVDNFLKPKIIGTKTHLHPVFILIGILGGIIVFGFIGIIIGPVILSALIIFTKIYADRENHTEASR